MILSIVIVNWNTAELLRECLLSIERSHFDEPMETVVVDNASGDGSADLVRVEFPWVRLHESGQNLGYAAGNNVGFSLAAGEWVLALNPDTRLRPDALRLAVRAARHNPDSGAIAAKLIGPDGETQASVRGFPSFLGIFGDATGLGRKLPGSRLDGYRLSSFDYETAGPAPQPMGTFLMFRRAALKAVGDPRRPFDESFPIFFNEVDLLKRLADAGWNAWYDPAIQVEHWGGASTRQVRRSMIWESHRSLTRYLRRHCCRPWQWPAFLLAAAAIWVAAWIRARGFNVGFRP